MANVFGDIIVIASIDDDILMHDMLYAPTTMQSRYCPDMPGVQMQNIGNGEYMNPITGEIYDFLGGFKSNGKPWGGGSISSQTNSDADMLSSVPHEPLMFRKVL